MSENKLEALGPGAALEEVLGTISGEKSGQLLGVIF
jgi:hypothetical protein